MKLSAQEEYGLRCLVRMGHKGPGQTVTIPEISQAEGLSVPYVAKLMRILREGGFVRSVRGQAGGYTLARPPDQISAGEALAVLGGRFFESGFCEEHAGTAHTCTRSVDCSIRSVWRAVQQVVDQVLGRITLKDLLCSEEQMAGRTSALVSLAATLSDNPLGVN